MHPLTTKIFGEEAETPPEEGAPRAKKSNEMETKKGEKNRCSVRTTNTEGGIVGCTLGHAP